MIKILFITHSGSVRPPMAEFIMKKMVADENMGENFYISSAHVQKAEGDKLDEKARETLEKNGVPPSDKTCQPLAWRDYDMYTTVILMDEEEKWPFMKIIGGDPEHKVHRLAEYAGIHGDIMNPEKTGDYDTTFRASLSGCAHLYEKLRDWVK